MLIAEEQPVLSARACRIAFGDKGTEGSNARPRPDHDDVLIRSGQLELRIPVDIKFKGLVDGELRQRVGTQTVFRFVIHAERILRHRDMHFPRMRVGRRGDGIKSRGGWFQDRDHFLELGGILHGIDLQQIEQPDPGLRNIPAATMAA